MNRESHKGLLQSPLRRVVQAPPKTGNTGQTTRRTLFAAQMSSNLRRTLSKLGYFPEKHRIQGDIFRSLGSGGHHTMEGTNHKTRHIECKNKRSVYIHWFKYKYNTIYTHILHDMYVSTYIYCICIREYLLQRWRISDLLKTFSFPMIKPLRCQASPFTMTSVSK